MRRRARSRVTAVLAAVLALVLGAAPPAVADPPIEWTMAPCVVPRFDSAQYDWFADMVVVLGSGTKCAPTEPNSGFRIAAYFEDEPEGIAEGYNVRLFEPASSSPGPGAGLLDVRRFGAAVLPPDPGEYGVCLLAGANERQLCVRMEVWIGGDGKTVYAGFKEMAVNDPLVSKPVRLGVYDGSVAPPDNGGLGGTCGTCF